MKKIFLVFLLLSQVNPAYSYSDGELSERIKALNYTFMLQSSNFFSEADKLNNLAENPDANPDNLYMLYITSSQSLCISVLSLEKTQSLIQENSYDIEDILTRGDIKNINDTADIFNRYLEEFELDHQQCKDMVPSAYQSIINT